MTALRDETTLSLLTPATSPELIDFKRAKHYLRSAKRYFHHQHPSSPVIVRILQSPAINVFLLMFSDPDSLEKFMRTLGKKNSNTCGSSWKNRADPQEKFSTSQEKFSTSREKFSTSQEKIQHSREKFSTSQEKFSTPQLNLFCTTDIEPTISQLIN